MPQLTFDFDGERCPLAHYVPPCPRCEKLPFHYIDSRGGHSLTCLACYWETQGALRRDGKRWWLVTFPWGRLADALAEWKAAHRTQAETATLAGLKSDVTSLYFAYRTRPDALSRELDKLQAYYEEQEAPRVREHIDAKLDDLRSRHDT